MTRTASALVLSDVLERRAADDPDGMAFNVDGGAVLHFADWERRSRAVAHALLDAGLRHGDRVALWFSGLDWIGYAIGYLGLVRAGGTAVHLNDGMPPSEVDRRLAECGVSRVVHADRLSPPAGFAGPAHPLSTLDRGAGGPLDVALRPDDIVDIAYTSGTTGPARAYTVPHGNLTFGRKLEAFQGFRDLPATHMLVPMLLGSSTSATCVNSALSAQPTSVVCDQHDVERMGELIEQFKVTSIAITPWIAIQMLAAGIAERHDLSSLKTFFNGSAPMPPAVALRLMAMVPGAQVGGGCSQSEAGPALVFTMFNPAKPFSVGRPIPGTELRVADKHGEPAAQGQLGEIWLRHQAPRKLHVDPELSAAVRADGWYRTGDYGRLDADGELLFFDRGADLIRLDGAVVSSLEVEAVLYEHDAVREAAVFAAPRPGSAPEIVAAVALSDPGALADVEAFAAGRLTAAQAPVRYLTVDTLPRTLNGKVLKRELRERAGAQVPA
ncbi:MAG: acyl--CoA ligase [Actinobacteria bacterium]|nr:MAG: acyl--CoA ligase [Actinomycetota bacterium]